MHTAFYQCSVVMLIKRHSRSTVYQSRCLGFKSHFLAQIIGILAILRGFFHQLNGQVTGVGFVARSFQ